MAANRPRRIKKELPAVEHDDQLWTLKEKRRIQRALLKFSPHETDKIAKVVETKGVSEVKAYLELMEERLKSYAENRPKEAAELWGTLAGDLISCEMKDYSEALSEVMAVTGHLENTDTCKADGEPDYGSIYKYISSILAGEDLPIIGDIECSLVQDLMHSLMDTIRTCDTSRQQEIMLRKYHLLTSKIDVSNTMLNVERCRKAIINDFSDFEKKEDKVNPEETNENGPSTSSATGSSSAATSSTATTTTTTTSDSSSEPKQAVERAKIGRPPKRKPSEEEEMSPAQPKGPIVKLPEIIPNKRKRGRPSSKDMLIQPGKESEQTVQTSDPPQQKSDSMGLNSDQSLKTSEHTGLNSDQSLKTSEHTGLNSDQSQKTSDQTELTSDQSQQASNQTGQSSDNISSENQNWPNETGDGFRKPEDIPKKPALFTLNPFCIPIDLLRFQPLVSTEVVFKPNPDRHKKLQQVLTHKNKKREPITTEIHKSNSGEHEVEVICVDERHDVIGREKFISIIRDDMK